MWRCLKWTNKNARSKLFWNWTLYVKIHVVSRHSESKQLWDIRIYYIVPAGNTVSLGGFLLDQCCTSMAVWEGREDVSVVASTSNQCNQIRFALCNAECQVVHSTYMPMLTTKLRRRNRRRKSSQAWIAGLLNNFCNFCMQMPNTFTKDLRSY